MQPIDLLTTTGVSQVDDIIKGVICLLELMLHKRIRSYYLTGSYADGQAVPTSDIDLAVVIMGTATPEETQIFTDIRAVCQRISPCVLDLSLVDQTRLLHEGDMSLKYASMLVYGDDIRSAIATVPIEIYTRDAMHFPYIIFAAMRRNVSVLTYPLDYPDPTTRFYGYARRRIPALNGTVYVTTKQLLLTACWIGTAIVAYKAGVYVGNKRDCVRQYRQHVGDEWATLLEDIDTHCRQRWSYLVPTETANQEYLESLCQRELAFENHFLSLYREYLLAEMQHPDDINQQRAVERLGQIMYRDDVVYQALMDMEQHASGHLLHVVKETLQQYGV